MELAHLEEYDRRKYGSVLLIFYAAKSDLAEDNEGEVNAAEVNADTAEAATNDIQATE